MKFHCELEKAATVKKTVSIDGINYVHNYWRVQLLVKPNEVDANDFIDLQNEPLQAQIDTVQIKMDEAPLK